MDTRLLLSDVASLSRREAADIERVVNVANRVRQDLFPGDRLGSGDLEEDHQADRVVRCVTADGTLVGTATLSVKGTSLWVTLVAVVPGHTGAGLGARMLDFAARVAQQEGLLWLGLEAVDEGRLVDFYRRNGFEEVRRETWPQGKWDATRPFDLVTLRRPVSPPGKTAEQEATAPRAIE